MLSTRTALLVALAVALPLAGCTTTLNGGGTPAHTTAPSDCTPQVRETVDPVRDGVDPSAFPDRPATWNESSVRSYVVAFEEAYARNGALRETSTRVEVSVTDVSVSETDGAWVVHLASQTNTWAKSVDAGTATPTVVHGDGARVPVVYHLTDRGLYRREAAMGGTPSASATRTTRPERGVAVACFDG